MTAKPKSVWSLFDEVRKLRIPLYQRHYMWQKSHCEALWQDFLRLYERTDETHYIGCLVVSREREGAAAIVDGQQRLTSLLLLVRALACYLPEGPSQDGLQAWLAEENCWRLQPQSWAEESDRKWFDLAMTNPLVGTRADAFSVNRRLFDAWIAQRFPAAGSLSAPAIVSALERLQLAFVELDRTSLDEDTPALIFEKMNAEGRNLETQDLIRNHIFRLAAEAATADKGTRSAGAPTASAGQQSLFHNEWLHLERIFPERALGQMSHFFRDYLILKTGRLDITDGRGLVTDFKRYLDPQGIEQPKFEGEELDRFEAVEGLANDLWRHADAWGKAVFGNPIHGRGPGTARLRKALHEFSLISTADHYPLAMRLMLAGGRRGSCKPVELAACFEALAKFAVISLLTGTAVKKLHPALADLSGDPAAFAGQLHQLWHPDFDPGTRLRDSLLGPYASQDWSEGENNGTALPNQADAGDAGADSFAGALFQTQDQPTAAPDSIQTANFYHLNRRAVIFLLLKINEQLMQQTGDTAMAFTEQGHSLEHIMPQTLTDKWAGIDPLFHRARLHFIGNMTLVGKDYNSSISNRSLSDKIRLYHHSSYAITRRIARELGEPSRRAAGGDFDLNGLPCYIEDRARRLVNEAINLLAL
jgi:hypothetical protein